MSMTQGLRLPPFRVALEQSPNETLFLYINTGHDLSQMQFDLGPFVKFHYQYPAWASRLKRTFPSTREKVYFFNLEML